MTRIVAILLLLLSAACGKMPGSEEDDGTATDPQTADAVLGAILERLGTEYEEHGPEFVRRVPVVKQEVVVAHGFEDWREFSARVRLMDPDRDRFISRRITRRIEELLDTPRESTPPAPPAEAGTTAGEDGE